MAHDPTTYGAGLILVDQPVAHSAVSHVAHVTLACANEGTWTAQQCADKFQDAWNGAFTATLDTEATFEKPIILLGDGTDTPATAVAANPAESGALALACPSPQVALLLKKITALAGRKNRGRTYLPFSVDEAGISQSGLVIGDAVTDVQAACDAVLTSLSTFDIPMVIANRLMGVDPDTDKPYVIEYTVGPPVTQYILESYVATQRRRLVRS